MAHYILPPARKWRVPVGTSGPPILLLVWLLTSLHSSVGQSDPNPPASPPPIVLTGECLKMCNTNRPSNQTGSFHFTCGYEPDCLPACESCPKEVCDETAEGDNPWINWHCPVDPEYTKACKLECDRARQRDFQDKSTNLVEPFNFTCDSVHSPGSFEEQWCRDTCKAGKCPSRVCDPNKDANEYHCPIADGADLPAGECKDFCNDFLRDYPEVETVTVNCLYDSYYRPSNYPSNRDYCNKICPDCQTEDKINFVCDRYNPEFFYCVKDQQPMAQRSYKGPCKDRCERYQNGGPEGFYLSCDAAYWTKEEQDLCREDCEKCGWGMCDSRGLNCPGITTELDRLAEEQRQKEEEQSQLELERRGQEYEWEARDSDHWNKMDNLERETAAYEVGMWIVVALLVIVIALWIGHCFAKKGKPSGQAQVPGGYGQPGQWMPPPPQGQAQYQNDMQWQQQQSGMMMNSAPMMGAQPGVGGGGEPVPPTSGGA